MDSKYQLPSYQEDLQNNEGRPPVHIAPNEKGVKVCLKLPDGSMVEQAHLKAVRSHDGKFVINTVGQNSACINQSGPVHAIFLNKKGTTSSGPVQIQPTQRFNSPNSSKMQQTPSSMNRACDDQKRKQTVTPSRNVKTPQSNTTDRVKQCQGIQPVKYVDPYSPATPSSQWNKIHETPSDEKKIQHVGYMVSGSDHRKRPRRSFEKGGKGLRHFSTKVCEKVKSKGVTTYLEVSEELVAEISTSEEKSGINGTQSNNQSYQDVKNIRRRVYDALNVLCAMNIISKDKKEIRWIGLPQNSLQECKALEIQKQEINERLREKKKKAKELMLQLIAYRTLTKRNQELERANNGPLAPNSTIQVPFIILSTGPQTEIGLEVSNDKTSYEFTFNDLFEMYDEIAILKKMGLCYGLDTGTCTEEGLTTAESFLPKSARPFLKDLFAPVTVIKDEQVEIVDDPQQIDIKYEPEEMTEVQRQAIATYNFDAPTYTSNYDQCQNGEDLVLGSSESMAVNSLLSLTAQP